MTTRSTLYPRIRRAVGSGLHTWDRLADQTQFYGQSTRGLVYAVGRYRVELLRLIAVLGLGAGSLALVGGTVTVVTILNVAGGAITSTQVYNQLLAIGVDALGGFTAAFFGVRFAVPLVVGIGLAVTIGASTTAQLGAMRINEEIDALEVMGVRSVAYLTSTRLAAALIMTCPLYCVSSVATFVASRFTTTVVYGQATGIYDHYFNTFLNPLDMLWGLLQAFAMTTVVMLVHTYYGFTASGGPAGVGEAVGRAVRASLVAVLTAGMLISLAAYGQSGDFHLSG